MLELEQKLACFLLLSARNIHTHLSKLSAAPLCHSNAINVQYCEVLLRQYIRHLFTKSLPVLTQLFSL